jgi:hypothetical protein
VRPIPLTMTGRLVVVSLVAAIFAGTALAAAGDPEKRAIRPADQAWAKRVNLTARDLPSSFLQQGRPSGSANGSFTCSNFAPDLSVFTITGQATSAAFTRTADGTTVFSAAEVFRSTGDERGDWARSARREALPCVARELERETSGTLRLKVTSSTIRRAPHVGDRAISFRIVATTAVGGAPVKLWFDVIGVARGRADATLAVISISAPPASMFENALAAKLARRLAV